MNDLVSLFLKLPPYVSFEGIEFVPKLINNGGKEMRLVYEILSVDADSPHAADIKEHNCFENRLYNPDGGATGFLYLYENIFSEQGLAMAIGNCLGFLDIHGLR